MKKEKTKFLANDYIFTILFTSNSCCVSLRTSCCEEISGPPEKKNKALINTKIT